MGNDMALPEVPGIDRVLLGAGRIAGVWPSVTGVGLDRPTPEEHRAPADLTDRRAARMRP